MFKTSGVIATISVLAFAAPAAAQDPTTDAYGGVGGVVQDVAPAPAPEESGVLGERDSGGSPGAAQNGPSGPSGVAGVQADGDAPVAAASVAPSVTPSSTGDQPIATTGRLPFTGLDMGLLGVGSLLLVAMGLGLRRLGRAPGATA